jgi:hypothetical protein
VGDGQLVAACRAASLQNGTSAQQGKDKKTANGRLAKKSAHGKTLKQTAKWSRMEGHSLKHF